MASVSRLTVVVIVRIILLVRKYGSPEASFGAFEEERKEAGRGRDTREGNLGWQTSDFGKNTGGNSLNNRSLRRSYSNITRTDLNCLLGGALLHAKTRQRGEQCLSIQGDRLAQSRNGKRYGGPSQCQCSTGTSAIRSVLILNMVILGEEGGKQAQISLMKCSASPALCDPFRLSPSFIFSCRSLLSRRPSLRIYEATEVMPEPLGGMDANRWKMAGVRCGVGSLPLGRYLPTYQVPVSCKSLPCNHVHSTDTTNLPWFGQLGELRAL
jgi:hypothetical protein